MYNDLNSGDIYVGVPLNDYVFVVDVLFYFAVPKSVNFSWSWLLYKIFSGLISKWYINFYFISFNPNNNYNN